MPEVSSVSENDYPELAAFLAAFPDDKTGSQDSWLNRMHAWWNLNPAYVDGLTRGWLLRDGGKIVGFLGSIPWKFQLEGRETTVFAGTTWRVLPEFRGMSIALKRRQMEEQANVLHFSTTPRAEVVRILELLGYEPIRKGTHDQLHSVIILNFEKVLHIKLGNTFPGRAVAKCLAGVLGAVQSFRIRRLNHYRSEKVRELASAGDAFDELWNRTRGKYPNTNVRTAVAINWYCFSSREFEKRLLGYFDGEKLTGYMVLLSSEVRGMKILECVDLWIERDDGQVDVLGALVEQARQCAEQSAMDRVLLPHFDRKTGATYERLGLLQRSWRKRPEYYKGPRDLMSQITVDNSYFVLAQGDYGL